MILEENYTLSNEVSIPKLGLGTWFIKDENAALAVRDAVKLGYRHIDTAQAYGNEAGVGEGVNLPRLNGHPDKRVQYSTEVIHGKTSKT